MVLQCLEPVVPRSYIQGAHLGICQSLGLLPLLNCAHKFHLLELLGVGGKSGPAIYDHPGLEAPGTECMGAALLPSLLPH